MTPTFQSARKGFRHHVNQTLHFTDGETKAYVGKQLRKKVKVEPDFEPKCGGGDIFKITFSSYTGASEYLMGRPPFNKTSEARAFFCGEDP